MRYYNSLFCLRNAFGKVSQPHPISEQMRCLSVQSVAIFRGCDLLMHIIFRCIFALTQPFALFLLFPFSRFAFIVSVYTLFVSSIHFDILFIFFYTRFVCVRVCFAFPFILRSMAAAIFIGISLRTGFFYDVESVLLCKKR